MSLVDIMSAMRLHVFAEAALVLAAAGFVGVLVSVLLRRNREWFERARFMPLEDDRGTDGDAAPRQEAMTDER
jgi:cbb3-type cytochrome oxidase subunit 3